MGLLVIWLPCRLAFMVGYCGVWSLGLAYDTIMLFDS